MNTRKKRMLNPIGNTMKLQWTGRSRLAALGWFLFAMSAALWIGPAVANDDWAAGAGPEWEAALSAARAEGLVVVAGPAQIVEKMATACEKDTGIKIDYLGGSNRDVRTRFGKELAAGVLSIDVRLGGGTEVSLAGSDVFASQSENLLLPSVSDTANWRGDLIKWVDNANTYMPVPNEYVFGWALVNRDMAPEGAVLTWQDLLKPEFKGKIIAFDPTIPGPGQAAFAYLGHRFGEDYLRQLLVDQKVTVVRQGRQVVESVVLGNYAIALGAVAPHVERFRAAGIDNIYVPEMSDGPGSLVGGSSVPLIAKNAPHPNAAVVFLNWYMSSRGQKIFQDVWQTPSRRRDLSHEGLPAYVIPQDDKVYLDQYREEWYLGGRQHWSKYLREIIGN